MERFLNRFFFSFTYPSGKVDKKVFVKGRKSFKGDLAIYLSVTFKQTDRCQLSRVGTPKTDVGGCLTPML